MREQSPSGRNVSCAVGDLPSFLCQVMLGGHWFSELFGDPDTADPSTITRTALDTLRDHLGIRQTPSLTVTRVHKVYTHLCGYIGFLYHITSLSKYFIG